jgi:hypothetical protein
MHLEKLVGQAIIAKIPQLNSEVPLMYRLVALEHGGLWLESQDLTNQMLEFVSRPSSPKTLLLFVPLAQVAYILDSGDYPALSEKAFGLKAP